MRERGPSGLIGNDGEIVGKVVAEVEKSGQQQQAGVEIAAQSPDEEQAENPEDGGKQAGELDGSGGRNRGPARPVRDDRQRTDGRKNQNGAAAPSGVRAEDRGRRRRARRRW